jgi:outer membrane lipopolysaccharide assembly protein LptE/RlpB
MRKIMNIFLLVGLVLLLASCQNTNTSSTNKDKSLNVILSDISDKYDVINYGSDSKEINIDVKDTEKASEVKKDIENQLQENGLDHYKVNVHERNIEQVKKENQWFKLENKALTNLQENKEYRNVTTKKTEVKLNKPVVIALSTPVSTSDDSAKTYAKGIEQNINKFLQSQHVKDPYKIVIYDKDDNIINT